MGKSTISMVIFNSYVNVYQRVRLRMCCYRLSDCRMIVWHLFILFPYHPYLICHLVSPRLTLLAYYLISSHLNRCYFGLIVSEEIIDHLTLSYLSSFSGLLVSSRDIWSLLISLSLSLFHTILHILISPVFVFCLSHFVFQFDVIRFLKLANLVAHSLFLVYVIPRFTIWLFLMINNNWRHIYFMFS